MIGITSYGAYIPRLRIERMTIFQNMGWYIPAIVMVAQGERSFCNWDEDPITMAVAAARDCLGGRDKAGIEGLYLCSTSLPFADRLNAGLVKGALNLADEVRAADLTSSLRSGTSGLLAALDAVGAGSMRRALVAASDQRLARAASFYEMWYGDGAAAVELGTEGVIAAFEGGHSLALDFVDHYRGAGQRFDYTWEERWVRDAGFSEIIPRTISGLLEKQGRSVDEVDRFIYPCFFKAEHRKIAKKLGVDPARVVDNMHEVCGDCGSAQPLLMLAAALEEAKPGERLLVAGFGQGCDALLFQVTEAIADLPKRTAVTGHLQRKKIVDSYTKFLKFRDLIECETGIRAEAPTQTATSVLWRQRDMLTGLVGGRCSACDTPQFPRMDICVNPECQAHRTQEPYEFADRLARVKTFTGDFLAVSQDPPAIYGMIQFEGGGRMLADFSDCEYDEVFVGQPVRMAFRKKVQDDERGFSGYFWKAVPEPGEKPTARAASRSGPGREIRLDDRVAIVTGAGGGLGRAYALELARRGAKVVVNDLGGSRDGSGASQSPAAQVVEEIRAAGGEAVANFDSVADPAGGQAIVQCALDTFGRLDILINNAGILRDKTLAKMSEAEWRAVLDVHLYGAFWVSRPAMAAMRENNYGRIIMTTSAAGLFGNFGQTNYSAAKLGLVGLMNTLKLEGGKYDIAVNTIAPLAMTRLTEDLLPPDMAERLNPDFVVPLVVHLCSEDCRESGQVFNVGAGFFNRAAVVASPGLVLGDGAEPPTVEDVFHHFEQIDDLAGAEEFSDAMASLSPMMAAFDQGGADGAAPAQATGGVADVFARMPEAFRADRAAGVDVVFQYSISGEGGGEWFAVIRDGTCEVQAGQHEKPTTTIRMAADDFLAMMGGQLKPMQAFTTGKLKIEGDVMKSQLIEKLFSF